MVDEFWATTKTLDLPPGVYWPAKAPIAEPEVGSDGKLHGHSYEKGWGTATAQTMWYCAWQREWLSQFGHDNQRATTAYQKLLTFKSMDQYVLYSDQGTRDFVDSTLSKAALGDPSLVQNNVNLNCHTVLPTVSSAAG
ncbi:hypothetical protein AB0M47_07605 [Hamadaea sp. NPDC051192]|uniref:hypothetical protein n=1 Tax=Hamadaea sp. NPDC051192 TaxID=3154940 RepID=UPI003429A594